MFEKFFGNKKNPQEEVVDMNREVDEIGEKHYKKIGDRIQEEISTDFEQVKYNRQKALPMMELMKECIRDNPKDLFENLELTVFLEALSEICDNGKYNYKDREKIAQLLRDIEAYMITHPNKVNAQMTAGDLMDFLFKLYMESIALLGPEE